MADQKIDIDIVTKQSGDGAKKTAEDIGKIDVAAQSAGKAQAAAGAEAGKAATESGGKWKAFGNVLRSLVRGDMAGAANAASGLGGSFAAAAGVAGAAITAVTMAVKAAVAIWVEKMRVLNEVKFGNLEASAKSLGERFEEVKNKIDAAKASADAFADAGETVADAEATAKIAGINAERSKKLAAAGGDEEAKNRINADADVQVADITAEREQGRLGATKKKRDRERKRIQEQLGSLDQRDSDYEETMRTTDTHIEEADAKLDIYDSGRNPWAYGGNLATFGWTKRKAKGLMEDQNRLREHRSNAVKGLGDNELERRKLKEQQALLDANEPALDFQSKTVDAMNAGAHASSAGMVANADLIRDNRIAAEKAAAREAAAAAEKEAAARSAYEHGGSNLNDARGSVGNAENAYSNSPSVGSAKALQEAKAALKEQENTFKELANALTQAARENARHAKTAKADLSAE